MPYEGPNLANQNRRTLGVFEEMHSLLYCNFDQMCTHNFIVILINVSENDAVL